MVVVVIFNLVLVVVIILVVIVIVILAARIDGCAAIVAIGSGHGRIGRRGSIRIRSRRRRWCTDNIVRGRRRGCELFALLLLRRPQLQRLCVQRR